MTTSSPTSSEEALTLVTIKPGVQFGKAMLKELLPDIETTLFFAKVYDLDAQQLASLLLVVHNTPLTEALFGGDGEHSHELQDYLLDGYVDEYGHWHDPIIGPADAGQIELSPVVPAGEILPAVWKDLEVEVASSIKEVAAALQSTVGLLPGKQGSMVFGAMRKINAKRPTIGDYRAKITHAPQKQNLLILDVSGSMSEETVRAIVEDVVALSYMANAHFATVSNQTHYWEPGTYDVDAVLASAAYGGTHYETLDDLIDQDWGVVITIADYDSSPSAKRHLAKCTGHIDQVVDVSLVSQPTFLAECVGQRADKVRPMLIAEHALTY